MKKTFVTWALTTVKNKQNKKNCSDDTDIISVCYILQKHTVHAYVPTAQSTDDFISDMSRSGQKQHAQQMWREKWSN